MKELSYKTFSRKTHVSRAGKASPSACEFEVTFACGLRCVHCYCSCFNTPEARRKELDTRQVKGLLDQAQAMGVVWLCLTGGDPLSRPDFEEIYAYARGKGFIITLFTTGYSITGKIARFLAARPPFNIEITLNAATPGVFDRIAGKKGAYARTMRGISLLKRKGLPLRFKSLITSMNAGEVKALRKRITGLGGRFSPDFFLLPRLNGDQEPCSLRLAPEELVSVRGNEFFPLEKGCRSLPSQGKRGAGIFRCAADGGDGVKIDPYGRVVTCVAIREPAFDARKDGLEKAYRASLRWARSRAFPARAACMHCAMTGMCESCAGKAYLEEGALGAPVDYYCRLAQVRRRKGTRDE